MTVHLEEHLTFKKIFIASYASILMMVFTSIYSIVDGVFISNFAGNNAFAGLNLVFPYIMILGAFGYMFGSGGSALISKTLGEKNKELANKYCSMIVYFIIGLGVIGGVIGFFTVEPFVKWMASLSQSGDVAAETISEGILYGRILTGGIILMMLQYVFQSLFLICEKPKLGFLVIAGSGLINISLDALFIAGFRWGIAGAAAATLIGQSFGAIFPIVYFSVSKNNMLKLGKPIWDIKALAHSAWNGSSEFVSNISSSIVGACFNAQLLVMIGQDGVAAYGIVMYISYIFMAIFMGYAAAMAPFIGFQFGAGNKKELSNILRKSFILIAVAGLIMFGLCQLLADPLASFLSGGSAHLKEIAVNANRIYSFVYLSAGFTIFTSSYFTSLNNGTASAVVSFCRSAAEAAAVFVIPLWLGVNGIWASSCFAEIVSTIVMLAFLFGLKKRYGY